jgi:hypothetical protein
MSLAPTRDAHSGSARRPSYPAIACSTCGVYEDLLRNHILSPLRGTRLEH